MKLAFDTNVYVSAFVVAGSKSDLAFRLALRGAFGLVISEAILAELHEKLGRRSPAGRARARSESTGWSEATRAHVDYERSPPARGCTTLCGRTRASTGCPYATRTPSVP